MRRTWYVVSILFATLIPAVHARGATPGPGREGNAAAAGTEIREGERIPGKGEEGGPAKVPTKAAVERNEKPKVQGNLPGMPVYRPPLRGTPGGRVGGGTRGGGEAICSLTVLAPDHTGLTAREQPSLYWYLSGEPRTPVELTVAEDNAVAPLLETPVKAPVRPGVNRVALSDYGIRLSPGVTYKWFVSIVSDPTRRSRDVVAGGMIRRVDLPEMLAAESAGQGASGSVARYAEAGFWYDAVQAISELIDGSADDALLRRQRASLMDQAELPEVAEYDMGRIR